MGGQKEYSMNKMNLKQQPLKITHRPQPKRRYFDVGLGAICLGGADTGEAYCLLDISLAPGIGVPRHTHTREDETYYVLSGELKVEVGDQSFLCSHLGLRLVPGTAPAPLPANSDGGRFRCGRLLRVGTRMLFRYLHRQLAKRRRARQYRQANGQAQEKPGQDPSESPCERRL